jgi:hypothetical protein
VEAKDAQTGRSLAKQAIEDFGSGVYAPFEVSGDVLFEIRSRSWMSVSLSGILIDRAPGQTMTKNAARALDLDRATRGEWQGKYGELGFQIFGTPASLPADISLVHREDEKRIEHKWPAGVRRYSYRRTPVLPFGSYPKFDNAQIAFNVIPQDEKAMMMAFPPGTRPGFIAYEDTDYEYALNTVAEAYGGGYEVWRCLVPGMPRKHFYPRQPASPFDGAVHNAQLAVSHRDGVRIIEAAIPWKEIPLVKMARDEGRTVKFTFRINDGAGPGLELPANRSVSKTNSYALHPDWVAHWANEIEFAFEK